MSNIHIQNPADTGAVDFGSDGNLIGMSPSPRSYGRNNVKGGPAYYKKHYDFSNRS